MIDPQLVTGFLASVPDSVFFKDKDSRYLAVSDSLLRHHGLASRGEIIGKTDFELFACGHAGLSLVDEPRIIRTGEPVLQQLECLEWADGRTTWIVTTRLPLRGPGGQIVGTFGVNKDVTEAKQSETALEAARADLARASHWAGMAEVATGVLHNVGNVLNSLNVSASVVASTLRQSKAPALAKVSALLREKHGSLAAFLADDPKGRLVPEFLRSLARQLAEDRALMLGEIDALRRNLEHIKEIVADQRAYATSGAAELLAADLLMDDSLRMNAASLARDRVTVIKDYALVPPVLAQRGKVLQILINLIRNAQQALNESGQAEKTIQLSIAPGGTDEVVITVRDNGMGISAATLEKLFTHGFTTRKDGHGFGLRSCAQAARELGGTVAASSPGLGLGAAFTVTLPARSKPPNQAFPTPAAESLQLA